MRASSTRDLNPGDPVAAERFRAVSRAFEVLSDPQRRAAIRPRRGARRRAADVAEVGFAGFDFSVEASVARAGFREIFQGVLQPAGARRPGARARTCSRSRA